jgi:hypothetical protein
MSPPKDPAKGVANAVPNDQFERAVGASPRKKGQLETPSFGTAGREHVERHEKRDTSSIIVVSWIIELFGSRIHPE